MSPALPSVAVVGGSLGGLTAALVLADLGCDVRVLERSGSALEGRGAGIVALDDTLRWVAERSDVDPETLCSTTSRVRFVDPGGATVHEREHHNRFSSWNTIYRAMLADFEARAPDRYGLGREVTAIAGDADGAVLTEASGATSRADLVVAADGIASPTRAALLPGVAPRYAGYVAWRGTVPESELPEPVFAELADAITYQVLPGSHVLVYPIPGPSGSVVRGERLTNFVWYRNVAAGPAFDDVMTGVDGQVRPVSLPPGAMRPEQVSAFRSDVRALLAPVIAEAVLAVAEPFVQAVHDIEVPRMAFGRVCLAGDAAFAVRPHAGAGTAKAAADGWELAAQLTAHPGDVDAALAAWERTQLAMGRALLARCREIGDSSQFTGTFTPGDPALSFGLRGPGR
ncbi:FAD-dependent monooxygenase [Pseudonocardia sp. N23]|uniref:FAD binding domain-containing protein n=1 Tax=Pseudonocardia sp. N23 TaxID=1987376 RepID=UPI000BFCE6AC|nr:FAD-dependent monooxygenase [Pseudonocardia sp. N23]GAY10526.1 salicylate hydroxylase [Pseudonocardia sp. N23]